MMERKVEPEVKRTLHLFTPQPASAHPRGAVLVVRAKGGE